MGDILTPKSGWTADPIVAALDLLCEIRGDPIPLRAKDHRAAVKLALEYGLTFYDSSYAAIAARTGRVLLSADDDLLEPGLAASLRDVALA